MLTDIKQAAKTFYTTSRSVLLVDKRGVIYIAGWNHHNKYSYHTIDTTHKSVIYGHYGYKTLKEAIQACTSEKKACILDYGVDVSLKEIK